MSLNVVTTSSSVAASTASEVDLKKKADDKSAAASAKPMNPVIMKIADVIRSSQNFAEALKLKETLPEGSAKEKDLKGRVEKIILLPFHKFLRKDFSLICHYKSLRLQALAGDIVAQEKLVAWHSINILVDKLLLHSNIYRGHMCDNPQVNLDPEFPLLYVNFIQGVPVTHKKDEEGNYFLEVKFENGQVCRKQITPETKFVLFALEHTHAQAFLSNLLVIEGREVDRKIKPITWTFLGVYDTEKNFQNIRQRADELASDYLKEFTLEQLLEKGDFEQKETAEMLNCLAKSCFLYRNEESQSSLFVSGYHKISSGKDFLSNNHYIWSNYYPNLYWMTDSGPFFKITDSFNKKHECRSHFDPNGLRYQQTDKTTFTVTTIPAREGLWNRDQDGNYNLASLSTDESQALEKEMQANSFSLQFKKGSWQQAAAAFIKFNFSQALQEKQSIKDFFSTSNGKIDFLFSQFTNDPNRHCFEMVLDCRGGRRVLFLAENRLWHTAPSFSPKYLITVEPNSCYATYSSGVTFHSPSPFNQSYISQFSGAVLEPLNDFTVTDSQSFTSSDASKVAKEFQISSYGSPHPKGFYLNQNRLWFALKYQAIARAFTAVYPLMIMDLIKMIDDFDKPQRLVGPKS